MNNMTYQQTIDFLFSQLPAYHRIGKAAYKNNLDNSLALDEYFKHPHNKYKTIHIAGTNGKGSVSHLIASVLQEAGYKTGLYTSPHLKDFRERIKINGEMIPEKEVTEFVENHKSIIEILKPSFFEMSVAMAFHYFSQSNVDIAVIEVGLGGRLDSTNIINPVLSVITNIGHDHMDLLGNTIGKIGLEKAGIIKEKVPVVISETQKEISEIFISRAIETGSDIKFADQNFSCILNEFNIMTGERGFTIKDCNQDRSIHGTTVLGGDYQSNNLKAVFQVFSSLKRTLPVSEINITDGIQNVVRNTGLSGRWQVLNHSPLIVCDTGHNKEGLEYVLKQIKRTPKKALHMIIGFVSDKDLSSVLPLLPENAFYYFTKASVPRAMDENILKSKASEYHLQGKGYPDVKSALKAAIINASASDMIFIGGSTFIVADALLEFSV
jgi:dihydrofolate synthase / folylpolyglutamate synthase